MTNNQFEKQISDKLDHYEVEPSEGLLDSIFEKRAAKTRLSAARRLSSLFLVSAIVISAVLGVYFLDNKKQKGIAGNNAEKSSNSPIKPETDKAKERELNAVKSTESVVKTPEPKVMEHGFWGSYRSNHPVKPSGTNTENTNSIPAKANDNTDNYNAYESANVAERYFDINSKNRPRIAEVLHNGNSHLYVYHTADESSIDVVNFTGLKPRLINKLTLKYKCDALDKVMYSIKDLKFRNKKPVFIDALVSPMLSTTGSSGNTSLKAYADNLAVTSVNTQFGLRVTVPVYKRYSVFSGLSYLNHVNAYKGSIWTEKEQMRINKVTSYINDPVLGVIKVESYDTSNVMIGNSTNYNVRNSYRLFQLPIGVAYNFGYRKFDFAINGSALFNMFMHSEGKSIDVNNNRTNSFESDRKFMSIGTGLSFMGAYKLSPKLRFIIEPGIQFYKIQSMKAGNNHNENIINRQLNLGIRYTLF